jgi:hypothetical protein
VATAQPQREITNDSTVVVLVSFGRSGSTFVASLLESHPLVPEFENSVNYDI